MTTITQTITTLPTAPDPATMTPTEFSAAAAAYVLAQKAMVPQLNTWAGQANTVAGEVNTNANAAAASAVLATAAAGAELWVSGQAYVNGEAAISGIDYQAYRANTNTSGTTDPSLSAAWTLVTVGEASPLPTPITTVTATAAATALLNSGLTSAYSVYDLICIGATSAADGLNLRVELGGSVISTSTYIYASDGLLSGTGAVAAANAGTGAPVSSVPLASPGGGAARPFYLKARIIKPSSGSQATQLVIDQNVITSADQVRRQTVTAMNTGTTALTGVQLIPVTGTITCTMNLYPVNL